MKEFSKKMRRDWRQNRTLYLLVLPVLLFYVLFAYKPMYGALIAFKDYTPALGFADSPWVGFDNFKRFFDGIYFGCLMKNTILLSFYNLIFGFPAPVILALLLNEVRNQKFKRLTQTITYLPHFISMIVVADMITNFCMTTGVINDIIAFGGVKQHHCFKIPNITELFMWFPLYGSKWAGVLLFIFLRWQVWTVSSMKRLLLMAQENGNRCSM